MEDGDNTHTPTLTRTGEPSILERIFTGPNGIRAGWRLLIFLILAAIVLFILGFLLRPLLGHSPKGINPFIAIASEGIPLFAILIAALIMAQIEKRPFAVYGLPLRGAFGTRFWLGTFWGFAALTALLLVIRLAHGFYFGRVELHGPQLAKYAAGWALAFLVVAFFEEFLTRGYALYTLTSGIGFWPSAVLLSIIFGAGHIRNPGEDWIGAVAAAFIGVFFCFTVRRTGSLWFAVGLHAMWDYSESFLYSVPDSGVMVPGHLIGSSFVAQAPRWLTGGSVGPEGSYLVFVVVAVMFIVFNWLYPEVLFPSETAAVVIASSPAAEILPLDERTKEHLA